MHTPVGFGLTLPALSTKGQKGADYVANVQRRIATLANQIDSLWFVDHIQYDDSPLLEGWTGLTYWAALQPRFEIGHVVLCQSFRNPALLAKMAATLHYLTSGRFILGIGAGWKEDEYRAYGYDFPSAGKRLAELEEAVQIIKALWTGKQTSFEGKHYQVIDAYCLPQPDPLPPIMIGGDGPRMLRLIARQADWWNVSWEGLESYRKLVTECERACAEVGRDPASLHRSWFGGFICAEDEERLQQLNTRNTTTDHALIGTPQQIIEQMQAFIELGIEHFELSLSFDHPLSDYSFDLLANEVLPALKRT